MNERDIAAREMWLRDAGKLLILLDVKSDSVKKRPKRIYQYLL